MCVFKISPKRVIRGITNSENTLQKHTTFLPWKSYFKKRCNIEACFCNCRLLVKTCDDNDITSNFHHQGELQPILLHDCKIVWKWLLPSPIVVCFPKCVFLLGYERVKNRYKFGNPTVTPLLHTKTRLDRKPLISDPNNLGKEWYQRFMQWHACCLVQILLNYEDF